jgi:ferrous-iron efflux pump FieF
MVNSSYYSETELTLLKTAPYVSVSVAAIICIIKSYCWLLTDSMSIFASLVDSILDISASLINLFALHLALMPPDHNHRFGHGKIEDLAVFGQSILIALSGLFALYSSCKHLFLLQNVESPAIGIYGTILCCILTVLLLMYQSFVIKKTRSKLIAADKLHYMSDLFTNCLVLISLYYSHDILILDAALGTLIACYIIYSSYDLFTNAIKNLVDEEFSNSERQKILDIVAKKPEVLGIHDIKTRYAGNKPFIQFHLEMDGEMNLNAAHKLSDEIMHDIVKIFKGAEVTIHQDPHGLESNIQYKEDLGKTI